MIDRAEKETVDEWLRVIKQYNRIHNNIGEESGHYTETRKSFIKIYREQYGDARGEGEDVVENLAANIHVLLIDTLGHRLQKQKPSVTKDDVVWLVDKMLGNVGEGRATKILLEWLKEKGVEVK